MFTSNKYIIKTFKLVESYVIKLHSISVRMNMELQEEGLDRDDPYSPEDLQRLGIRDYTGYLNTITTPNGIIPRFSLQLTKDEMSEETYDLITDNGKKELSKLTYSSREDEYALLGWRYYKHLMGEYHSSDYVLINKYHPDKEYDANGIELDGLVFKSLDDGLNYTLTKEALINNPVTRIAMLDMGEYYTELVDKYPKFESLIKGITYPVLDVNLVIHSDSGSILNYNDKYVAYNEHNLIYDVGSEVTRYISRWDVVEYTIVDNLYTAALFAGMTTTALYATISHRLSKVGTSEVSEFHLEEFFKSNFAVANESKYLTKYSQIWLYKNLKNIIQNVGKEETLMSIVDNIIEQSPLSISEVLLKLKAPIRTEDGLVNHLAKQYVSDEENTYKSHYRTNGAVHSDIGIDSILIEELEMLERRHGSLTAFYLEKDKAITKEVHSEYNRTKVMYLEYEALVNTNVVDSAHILLDNMMKYAFGRALKTGTFTFKSKYSATNVDVTYQQGALLAIKFLLEVVGESDKLLSNYVTTTTVNYLSDPTIVTSDLHLKVNVEKDCNLVLKRMPIFETINNKYDLEEYIVQLKLWYFEYYSISSSVDVGSSAKMDSLMERIRTNETITLSDIPKTIDEVILDSGLEVEFSNKRDSLELLYDMIYLLTGLDFDPNKSNEDLIKAYVSLIDKLTSYTTQTLHKKANDNVGDRFHTLNALYGIDISLILDADYKCLEDFNGIHVARVDDDLDTVVFNGGGTMRFKIERNDLKHTADIYVGDKTHLRTSELRYNIEEG